MSKLRKAEVPLLKGDVVYLVWQKQGVAEQANYAVPWVSPNHYRIED